MTAIDPQTADKVTELTKEVLGNSKAMLKMAELILNLEKRVHELEKTSTFRIIKNDENPSDS